MKKTAFPSDSNISHTSNSSNASALKNDQIRIALIETDPLRLVGFRALFESEPGFEVVAASFTELSTQENVDLVLGGNRRDQSLFDMIAGLKATRPDLRIVVTGSGADDESILKAVEAGAKGYIDESAPAAEYVMAMRVVHSGSVWAPRRVLSTFIERATSPQKGACAPGRAGFTGREKEVLQLLVAGHSNKEIGSALDIEERTVKAHVAKLMRKVGVQNRIALSVHALTHSLVTSNA